MKVNNKIITGYLKKNIPNCTDVLVFIPKRGEFMVHYVVKGMIYTVGIFAFMKDFKNIESIKTKFAMIL
jgi:hypothetical protein